MVQQNALCKLHKGKLRKCKKNGTEIKLALLNYRNTLRDNQLGSPNLRLISRTTRSVLPITENKLKPKTTSNVTESLNMLRKTQKIYHDRNTA